MSDILKMFCLLILLSISDSIDCENQRQNWCSIVKPKGVYKGLGLYLRYYENKTEDLVMFNRLGTEWLFDVTFDQQNRSFNIEIKGNSVKYTVNKGIVDRFGVYEYLNHSWDCRVETTVKYFKYIEFILFSIICILLGQQSVSNHLYGF